MIKIDYTKKGKMIEFSSSGHATHDICVAVTAINSAMLQYIQQKAYDGDVEVFKSVYESGCVIAKFKILKNEVQVFSGIEALLIANELYARNFPKEIEFEANYS